MKESVYIMPYRTKTYIAADWTGDIVVIEQLRKWNESDYWSLSFVDAHDLTRARDGSLNCGIKSSLRARLNVSKTFILIVGSDTKNLRSGSCGYCHSYNSWNHSCYRGHLVDYRSYIEYECEMAVRDNLKIVVIYNSSVVDKSKCIDIVKDKGIHLPVYYWENGKKYWNYNKIKEVIQK